jgi:hypothetical protein
VEATAVAEMETVAVNNEDPGVFAAIVPLIFPSSAAAKPAVAACALLLPVAVAVAVADSAAMALVEAPVEETAVEEMIELMGCNACSFFDKRVKRRGVERAFFLFAT